MKHYIHPQLQQLVTLLILLILGKYFSLLYPSWKLIFFVLISAFTVEHILIYLRENRVAHISYSSVSTAIGILLMMVSSQTWIYLAVVTLALLQKRIISIDNSHFFNPSNFALVAALLLFYNKSHVVLGQLGDQLWLGIVTVALATFILVRVDRWMISLSFLIFYLVFEYFLVVGYDPVMVLEAVYERFYSVSFIVFISFMLTDPRTTPDRKIMQVLFAAAISFLAAYLDRIYGFRVQHIFLSLFALSVWSPSLNLKFLENKKIWLTSFVLFVFALGIIMYIESQPPYYFDIEG